MISIPFDHQLTMNTNDIHQSPPFPLIHVDLNRDPNPSPDYFFPIHHHQDHYPHGANFVDELIIARGGPHDQPSSDMIVGDRRIGDCENENGHDLSRDHPHHREYCSVKWMSSKMRIRKKMTTGSGVRKPSAAQKFETDLKHKAVPPTILEKDDSSNNGNRSSTSGGIEINNNNNNNNNPIIIRVCSDCNTTKTPLWRSGPRGPKSLCNACGIRQRKARRAMALAAAAANGDPPPYPIPNPALKAAKKKKKKKKRSSLSENKDDDNDESDPQPKKKGKRKGNKIVVHPPADPRDICFEELRLRLSDRISGFQGMFPQDEKEAAILLMALSYGLVQS